MLLKELLSIPGLGDADTLTLGLRSLGNANAKLPPRGTCAVLGVCVCACVFVCFVEFCFVPAVPCYMLSQTDSDMAMNLVAKCSSLAGFDTCLRFARVMWLSFNFQPSLSSFLQAP